MARKKKYSDLENKDLCEGCILCCEHISIEIDEPEDREEIDEIIWYLMHKNVWVYIDEEDDWYIEFKTPCKALDKNGNCRIYDERPKICREYHQDECEKYGEGDYYEAMFKSRKEFLDYINKTAWLRKIYNKESKKKKK